MALPLLLRSKGSIVNVATVLADQPFANLSVYSAEPVEGRLLCHSVRA